MVDEKPSVRIESTLTNTHQDTETADKLRESISTKPPTQTDFRPDAKPTETAMSDVLAMSRTNTPAANLAALQSRMTDNAADSSVSSFVNHEIENSAAVRRTLAYGASGFYAVPGAFKAAAHDFTHPSELIEKAATAAAIGVGMKVLLPKTGAGKAIVGAVMGYYMVKDAAEPLIHGWSEAGKAKNTSEVWTAAQHMGDGLGAFAWDAYVGSKVGLKAEKLTGAAMDGALGTARYAHFERTKIDVDKMILGKPLEAAFSPVNRLAAWASEKMVKKVDDPKIEFQEVKHKFAEVEAQHVADVKTYDIHLTGLETADGKRMGFSQTLDLFEQGHDPRKMTIEQAHQILGPMDYPGNRVDATVTSADATTNGAAAGSRAEGAHPFAKSIIGPRDVPPEQTPFGRGDKPGDQSQVPPTSDAAKPPAGDGSAKVGDKPGAGNGPSGKPYVTKAEQEVNAGNYGKLAAMNKTAMDAWTDKRVLIADATERLAGPVHAAITPEYTKMDGGYILPRNQMMQIAAQIKTEADLQYVMPLFSRFSMAATQHISDGLTETAALKYQLDLKALETHSELVRNMKKAGIDPDVVLQSKNPAVFSISHDGGAGPHTMRQIDGVWNVDHVLYPRNMIDTRSVTASGIYGHELGHDQYGGIAKLDESIREQVISDAITKGLGSRATEKINMPGVGDITKKDLIEAIFKAQADENTADIWGAAWTGHNSGGALGLLLQSLRKGGQLETRNVFGTEFKSPENPYGFEVHAFDALRPKIVASVMRARANGDARVMEYANALDRYSDEASKPGDYVFANMDNPGQTVTIPRKDMEDVIPHLIDAQLNTKLSALQGHSMSEILPDLPANLAKMDILADLMVDAITKGKKPSEIPFDVSQYKMIQVFGAGLPAASRLVAAGMDATEANTQVNAMSDYLRGLYHANDPHVDPLKPSALQTIRLSSPKSLLAGTALGAREAVHSTGVALGQTPQLSDWFASKATSFAARVGVAGIDSNYRNAITAQSLSAMDMSPPADGNTDKQANLQSKQYQSVVKDLATKKAMLNPADQPR
ncbi:MAG: hypothetical protein KGS72_09895 [Cyanobacteria bacterium REEB67]|nr:hypothetical protein [Cyanobacteria bacterium REEB67]